MSKVSTQKACIMRCSLSASSVHIKDEIPALPTVLCILRFYKTEDLVCCKTALPTGVFHALLP